MIEFRGVTKRYPDGTVAVDELTSRCEAGRITVFVGPSGCGKTTSMRMINRMIEPTSGTILVDGKDVMAGDRRGAAARHRLRDPAGRAVPAPHVVDNVATVPLLLRLEQGARRASGRRSCWRRVGLDAGAGQPLPGPAVGRPAAARRRGPRAGRRSADPADGRAVQRGRPGGAREPAGRDPAAAGRTAARRSCSSPTTSTRRSSSATRSRCSAWAASSQQYDEPRHAARPARPTTSSPASSARPRLPRAVRSGPRRALAAAASCARSRSARSARPTRGGCWSSTPTAARRAGSTRPSPRRRRRSAHDAPRAGRLAVRRGLRLAAQRARRRAVLAVRGRGRGRRARARSSASVSADDVLRGARRRPARRGGLRSAHDAGCSGNLAAHRGA